MAEAIVSEFKRPVGKGHAVAEITLIPSGGGVFEVIANGEEVFSKKKLKRHAEVEEVMQVLRTKV